MIVAGGQLTLKEKRIYERVNTLREVLSIFCQLPAQRWCIESGTEYSHRSLDAARGCIVARFTMAEMHWARFGEEIADVNSGTLKEQVVNKDKIKALKQQGLRDSLRALKCDVIPGIIEKLNLLDTDILGPDHADSLGVAYCHALGK